MDVGRSWPRNIAAIGRIKVHLLSGPLLRGHRRTWGATEEEVRQSWPGDELLPDPAWSVTHAVTIDAAPQDVWPWLAQLGQGRGGFYSFERLENLIGCRMQNTDRILPAHQDIAAAGEVRLAPQAALEVARVEPGRDLVLVAAAPTPEDQAGRAGEGPTTAAGDRPRRGARWSFHLRPVEGGSTRLVERLAFRSGQSWQERLFSSAALMEPVSFVMSQEMLRNIKALAESGGLPEEPSTSGAPKGRRDIRRWSDLSPRQQAAVLTLASVQLSLAVTAWADLATRPASEVNGRKGAWAAVIAVNFIGPILYFSRGRCSPDPGRPATRR